MPGCGVLSMLLLDYNRARAWARRRGPSRPVTGATPLFDDELMARVERTIDVLAHCRSPQALDRQGSPRLGFAAGDIRRRLSTRDSLTLPTACGSWSMNTIRTRIRSGSCSTTSTSMPAALYKVFEAARAAAPE